MIYVFYAIQLVLWVIALITTFNMDKRLKDQEKLLDLYRKYREHAEESRKSLIQLIDSQNQLIDNLRAQIRTHQIAENRSENVTR